MICGGGENNSQNYSHLDMVNEKLFLKVNKHPEFYMRNTHIQCKKGMENGETTLYQMWIIALKKLMTSDPIKDDKSKRST